MRCISFSTLDEERAAADSRRVDHELVEYLDRRFTQLKDELRTELRADLRTDIAASAADLRATIAASEEETRRYIDAKAAEARRHFDVVAEGLTDKIQLVAEGVRTVDQKVDRLTTETRTELHKVDRRLLHLAARVYRDRG